MTKGLETLDLRVRAMADSHAHRRAHPRGVAARAAGASAGSCTPSSRATPSTSSPCARWTAGGGTVVTFEVEGGKAAAFALMNALTLVDISNNLGDAKSLTTHPATTTHRRLEPEARAAVGITDGTVRVSVGLEDVRDLVADLDAAARRRPRPSAR